MSSREDHLRLRLVQGGDLLLERPVRMYLLLSEAIFYAYPVGHSIQSDYGLRETRDRNLVLWFKR